MTSLISHQTKPMKKKFIFSLTLIALSFTISAQNFVESLNGVKLGQYKVCLENSLGKPFKTGAFDDGWTMQAYILRPDSDAYMVAEFTKEVTDHIWSIQVTGDKSNANLLRGLHIGDSIAKVFRVLGVPSDTEKIEDMNALRYSFERSNYTVEIINNLLYSVKIMDQSVEMFGKANLLKLPDFKTLLKMFATKSKYTLGVLLSPDAEVYNADTIRWMKYTFSDELGYDRSGLLKVLLNDRIGLHTLTEANYLNETERMGENQTSLHVYQIQNHPISEIVMRYYMGKYRIWEVKYK